jgi:glycosyltransferase involved in cell wall biosynthesis
MKRILMIAYHFPPLRGSSGIQRTLRFARYLPEFGWEPAVLAAAPRAYPETSDEALRDFPASVTVRRAFALDTARHLALRGRYPGFLARPDRWKAWWLGAVPAGLAMIRQLAPHALWSTYPIATAHAIGHTLHKLSGLPWIADFRDPMAQDDYPPDVRTRASLHALESRVARRAARLVVTTPGAQRVYRARYPELAADRVALIENGYDEEVFAGLGAGTRAPLNPGCITLLHSGIVYQEERDPSVLMAALRKLVDARNPHVQQLRLRFRAPVHDARLMALAAHEGVAHLVEVQPAVDYRSALEEMLRADGLLVLQAASCNEQIPAKLYEYLRARRPIVALTDPAGDTARTLGRAGIGSVAPLDDPAAIANLLAAFLAAPHAFALPADAVIARHSRRARTAELAALLDGLLLEAASPARFRAE